jgi:hypothetical protein
MIWDTIEASEMIREDWQTTSDAIAVLSSRLVVPAPEATPEPVIQPFFADRLNDEQVSECERWLSLLQLGGGILEEDMATLLDHASSHVGPVACVGSGEGGIGSGLLHLSFPSDWKQGLLNEQLRKSLVLRVAVEGTDEHEGVVGAASVLAKLQETSSLSLNANLKRGEGVWTGTI